MGFMVIGFVTGAALLALAGLRFLDHLGDQAEMVRLRNLQPENPPVFDHGMIAQLPEPARRFFRFSIAEGTRLQTVADIRMKGQFGLGDKSDPKYQEMQAIQVLAPPDGFVWKMRTQSGYLRLSGSDSSAWTRFRIGGLLPVARAGGDADHARSAFGRSVAEAVFWVPAAVLPSPDVVWDSVDQDIARVTVTHNGLAQSVDLTVAPDGQPAKVVFQRWSNANPEQEYHLQPFGGYLSDFQEFEGYRLPTHVEAGNHIGTEEYFPFYRVDVTDVSFPQPER